MEKKNRKPSFLFVFFSQQPNKETESKSLLVVKEAKVTKVMEMIPSELCGDA